MIPIYSGEDPLLLAFLRCVFAHVPKVRAIDWDDTILLSRTPTRGRIMRTRFFGTPTVEFLRECPYIIQTWTGPTESVVGYLAMHPELPKPVCIIIPAGFPVKDLSRLPLPPGSEVIDDFPETEMRLPKGAVFRRVTEE